MLNLNIDKILILVRLIDYANLAPKFSANDNFYTTKYLRKDNIFCQARRLAAFHTHYKRNNRHGNPYPWILHAPFLQYCPLG